MEGDRLSYFKQGNAEAQVEGARLDVWYDDGSIEWADLFQRVQEEPVPDRWSGR
jgi:hypothetical protein